MQDNDIKNNINTEEATKLDEEQPVQQEDELQSLKINIAELEKLNANLKDQLLRKAAEFDNYKKRIENDLLSITIYSNEQLIGTLLPVLDDFDRFLQHAKEESVPTCRDGRESPFYKGVELIYNKMFKALEQQGLKILDSMGKPFNVNYHDALMVIPSDTNVQPNTVVQEIEKGYLLHEKVIRHAKVIVSGEPGNDSITASEAGAD
ncbi:MAG: nucleotide exchange factor GrpE [Bacteroidetes bacterium]|nr:nucleotide exchange factor GrpE [Bacteroidota bacterium]MBU1422705.1 nucleotide exchange factor GrpE [Bacteroidota bacterium]MBU2636446.1 nucleotide exchange factor GrpE [Bacteroidota bacterium]